VTDGVVVTEYQSQVLLGQSPTALAAIGINAITGQTAWTAAGDPTTTSAAQLSNGVVAGPGIPGAGTDGAAFTWVTSDGQGRVDVRDAQTGTLIYSNTADDLAGHESYTLAPGVGLLSTGEGGTVSIAPGGTTAADWLAGDDVAVAESGGSPVLLSAEVGVDAYPMSVLSSGQNALDPLAGSDEYLAAKMSVTADDKVLGTSINWFQHEVLSVESGQFAWPYNLSTQKGLAVFSLTGAPAANAARQPAGKQQAQKAPSSTAPRPSSIPLADNAAGASRIGTAQPAAQVEVHGYSKTGVPQLTEDAPTGYDPATIQAYLGLHGTGAGQTVAVVDALGDPNIVDDVNQFSAQFGLPQTCAVGTTSNCFNFKVTDADNPTGITPDPDWGLETAMDVEWIHAVAPQAAVVLVEAASGDFASLFHAVQTAAQLKPDAISMSWGISGEFLDETYYDHFCQLADSVCVVATGDRGNPGSYPAYNPATVAVGGTTLNLTSTGTVTGETAWSESGGGQSYVEPTPSYQKGVVSGGRGIPDVSYDADPATGVAVYDTYAYQGQSGWFQVGGTSLGAPSWSAIIASTDQLRSAAGAPRLTEAGSAAQQAIYASAGSLGQIVSGSNGACPNLCTAGPGYNFVTGLGSPRSALDATLAAAP
jgi:subtilase family serine protease